MKKSLQSSEWFLVSSLLLIMASLILISKMSASRAASHISLNEPRQKEILVTIEGAVKKPGTYSFAVGSSIEEILKKAKPQPSADLKDLLLLGTIEKECLITVGELSEITVSVLGAVVEPLKLTLPVGSRICDLRSKIILTQDAEKSFFRRKKKLKNGEIIRVPKKTVE